MLMSSSMQQLDIQNPRTESQDPGTRSVSVSFACPERGHSLHYQNPNSLASELGSQALPA